VDLRDQVRLSQVSAITRDGIEVRLPVSVSFRVNRGNGVVGLRRPWPYRHQKDVLQALFAEEVDPTGRSPLDAHTAHPWEELPARVAAHRLEQAISFYSLDQLCSGLTDGPRASAPEAAEAELLKTHRAVETALDLPAEADLGDPLARTTIGALVLRAVRLLLERRGFEICGGGIEGPIQPLNRQVTEQRVEVWKSRFITKVMDWQSAIERRRATRLEKMRGDAREALLTPMLEETGRQLQAMEGRRERAEVAFHLLTQLIDMAQNPDIGQMLPESALPALENLHEQMALEMGPGEEP
jgi:hypothetical protein